MNSAGEIVITARSYRTQEANREDARARLAELIAKAHIRQPKRIKTRASRAAKAKRVDSKTKRGAVKAARAKPRMDETRTAELVQHPIRTEERRVGKAVGRTFK